MAGMGMRDIKRRIKSVGSTKQITKAMEMVASAKLRKTKARLEESRPFSLAWKRALLSFLGDLQGVEHPMITPREKVRKSGYIVITGNRGLCGGYNTNVMKAALEHMKTKKASCVVAVGQKAKDFFNRRGYDIPKAYLDFSEMPDFMDAKDIRRFCVEKYLNEEVDEVYLVYTQFVSTISHKPQIVKLMPLDDEAVDSCVESDESLKHPKELAEEAQKEKIHEKMNYEPNVPRVLNLVVPNYLDSLILGGLLESSASEQGARRVAMENATNNAEEMIERLQLQYNRARQAAITQEISEIVGGAEALK